MIGALVTDGQNERGLDPYVTQPKLPFVPRLLTRRLPYGLEQASKLEI